MFCQMQITRKEESNWMKEENRTLILANGLFYTALILETLFVLLDKSSYILQYETWDFRITFLLFICKIALTRYSRREWLEIFLFGILGVISWYFTDREEIIRMVALIAACKGIDADKALKIVLYETVIGCSIIIGLSLAGIYGTVTVSGLFRGGGIEETRYCLGMGHPNALHCMFMMTLVLGMAVYRKQMSWFGYLGALLLNLGVYKLTDSRTSMLITTMAILLAAALHYLKKLRDKKWLYILLIIFILACVGWSVMIATVGVDPHILRQIDIRINGRFQWARSEGGIQYWSLFSNPANRNYFDMGYVRLFYWYGIIPAAVMIVILCRTVWLCYEQKAYDALLVIAVVAAYTLIEAHVVSVYLGRNYVLLYVGILWYNKQRFKEYSVYDIGKAWLIRWKKSLK